MSFEDLPPDWGDQPLTDPRLVADVLDLVVLAKDRRAGAVSVLICDDDGRLLQPVTITEIDGITEQTDRVRCFVPMVEAMGGRVGVDVVEAIGQRPAVG